MRQSNRRAMACGGFFLCLLAVSPQAHSHDQDFGEPWSGSGHTGQILIPQAGRILEFPARKVALLSWLSPEDLSGSVQRANDVWGYLSPAGREYAIVGLQTGTAFVEVTDPENPAVVAMLPGAASSWRDMASYKGFVYSVNETGDGIQVVDVRRIDSGKIRLVRTVRQLGLATVHNISINPDSGFAYLSGSNLGGLVAVDLSNPARPTVVSTNWPFAYVHDVLVVSYDKGRHAGREIAYAFAGRSGLAIIDVTDKTNMFAISVDRYPGLAYCHSGWLDENRRYLYVNDELDEREGKAERATVHLFKVQDFEKARYVKGVATGPPTIDHNNMVRGQFLYQANYESGLRILRIKRPKAPRTVAFFDTFPDGNAKNFRGAWGVYAGLPSGVVLVSDIQRGLFVLMPPASR